MYGSVAVETRVYEITLWVTTEIPQVKGEPLVTKGEDVSSSILPLRHL